MRKTLAISLLGAVLAAPLAAQAPNPCETFALESMSSGIHQFSKLPTIHRELAKSFAAGGVYVPALSSTVMRDFMRARGVVALPERKFESTEFWHVAIPGLDGVEFAGGIAGTLGCVWYDLFRVESGRIVELPGPDYFPENSCPGTSFRPALIDGRANLIAHVDDSEAPGGTHVLHAIDATEASREPVCELQLHWAEAGRFVGRRDVDRRDLEPFRPALAVLDANRLAIMGARHGAGFDPLPIFGPTARALPAPPRRTQTMFEAGGVAYVFETLPLGPYGLRIYALHRADSGAQIEIVAQSWHRVTGHSVK